MNRPPLTRAELEELVRLKQAGASHSRVAQALRCSPETVRKHWKRYRHGQIPRKRGRPARGTLSTFPELVRQTALSLKKSHSHWGPANVLIELRKQPELEGQRLPSVSRLAVFFQEVLSRSRAIPSTPER